MEENPEQSPDTLVTETLRVVLASTVGAEEVLIAETLLSRTDGIHDVVSNPLTGQLFVRHDANLLAPERVKSLLHDCGFPTREATPDEAVSLPSWLIGALTALPLLIGILTAFSWSPPIIALLTFLATTGIFLVANPGVRHVRGHLKHGFFSGLVVQLLSIALGSLALFVLPSCAWFAPCVASIPLGAWVLKRAELHARQGMLDAVSATVLAGQDTRPQNQLIANQLAKIVPYGMLATAVLALFIWVLAPAAMHDLNRWAGVLPWVPGRDASGWAAGLWAATCVLLLAMPGVYLLISAPALLCADAWAAANGVEVFSVATWHKLYQTRTVLFGRANVLTRGICQVTDVLPAPGIARPELIQIAAAVEANVESPVAKAIVGAARREHVPFAPPDDFWFLPGEGVMAESDGETIRVGSAEFVSARGRDLAVFQQDRYRLSREGKAEVFVVRDGKLLGMLGIVDKFEPDVVSAMKVARALRLATGMLSATPAATAKTLADQAGIPNAHGELAPGRAGQIVSDYKRKSIYPVVVLGCGMRHEAALSHAGVRVQPAADSIGEPDVRLLIPGVRPFLAVLQLARVAYFMISQNLLAAIALNFLLLPCAALGWLAPPLPLLGVGAITLVVVRRARKLLSFDAEADLRERLRR